MMRGRRSLRGLRSTAGLLILVLLLSFTTGCSAGGNGNTIKIGSIHPLTGSMAYEGQAFVNAQNIAIEKINNERVAFARLHEDMIEAKEREKLTAVAACRHVCDLIIARVVQSFGLPVPGTDEYQLDIPKPGQPDGKAWVSRVEKIDEDTYRIFCKLVDVPKMGEKKDPGDMRLRGETKSDS